MSQKTMAKTSSLMVDIRQSFFIHQQSNNEAQWQKKRTENTRICERRKKCEKKRKKQRKKEKQLLSFGTVVVWPRSVA